MLLRVNSCVLFYEFFGCVRLFLCCVTIGTMFLFFFERDLDVRTRFWYLLTISYYRCENSENFTGYFTFSLPSVLEAGWRWNAFLISCSETIRVSYFSGVDYCLLVKST